MMINNLKHGGSASDVMLDTPFYTEGPVIDRFGNVYVTNLSGRQILRIDADGHIDEWATSTCPNGQFIIAANGDHLVCNSQEGTIECFDEKGRFRDTRFKGKVSNRQIQCPNDLWVEADSGIFFTDSIRHEGVVAYIDKHGDAHLVAERLDYPNGIVYDDRRRCLYVAESYQNRILSISLAEDYGRISVLVNLPSNESGQASDNLPDGLSFDGRGDLWIAHYGMGLLHRFDMGQRELHSMHSGIPLSSNVCVTATTTVITGGTGEPGPGKIRIIKA